MLFANDTEDALRTAAALINTDDDGEEHLPDVASLSRFINEWKWTGNLAVDPTELEAVRALRPRLRRVWEGDETQVVEVLNGLLREFNALPQLVKHDDWDYHVHASPPEARISTRMAVEAAMAFVDLVRTKELGRLGHCEFPGCNNVVIDLSKNRSKRFCDAGCGNRAAVAAYRARQAEKTA